MERAMREKSEKTPPTCKLGQRLIVLDSHRSFYISQNSVESFHQLFPFMVGKTGAS